jgi:predicted RNA-binding Zn ribbon-like protein
MDEPAPGELALIERFLNTANLEEGTDEVADPAALAAWLGAAGLTPAGATFDEPDRERIVAFREALRELLLANHGGAPAPAAIATLDGAARLVVAFDADGSARLVPAEGGVDGVIGALLGIVARSQAEGTWSRLKACPAATCGWAFYDHSRNHSRTWCTMDVCGNRAKARSYRARHR